MEKVLRKLTQKDALHDLLLVNRVDLMRAVEIDGHSDHKVIKFKISVDRRKSVSKTSTLDIDFRLLRELAIKVSLENVFADAGVHRCRSLFKSPPKDTGATNCKAFNTISHRILLHKMSSTQLDKHIMWWGKKKRTEWEEDNTFINVWVTGDLRANAHDWFLLQGFPDDTLSPSSVAIKGMKLSSGTQHGRSYITYVIMARLRKQRFGKGTTHACCKSAGV
ncbi:hypothetical protein WISP_63910 [Willisornis vidua]|uniref:Uncharacterized protein n=1 Tax=Willisornis vidua TaxID=1566151 RepID=A0ABQ9DE80_9PASS|nr:hypothetical protein WISP_63910 [Willisornis vidua]